MVDVAFAIDPAGEVLAIMPGVAVAGDADSMACYAHVGQHGSCNLAGIMACLYRGAVYLEFKDLLGELIRIGYDVNVVPFGYIELQDYRAVRREGLNYAKG